MTEQTEATEEPTVLAAATSDDTDLTAADAGQESSAAQASTGRPRVDWRRILTYGVLPALALVLAMAGGYLKYVGDSARAADGARLASMHAASDSTVAMLSYQPDHVEQQLTSARDLLTGEFRNSYTSLIHDVVIPGARQKQISSIATVPAVASVSADGDHAVVLVFVNQTTLMGAAPPTNTASCVRVTLDHHDGAWLISDFQPV